MRHGGEGPLWKFLWVGFPAPLRKTEECLELFLLLDNIATTLQSRKGQPKDKHIEDGGKDRQLTDNTVELPSQLALKSITEMSVMKDNKIPCS